MSLLLPLLLQQTIQVFTPADIQSWEPHSFAGETRYELTQEGAARHLYARCEPGQASALFYRETIDLTQTPYLTWLWQADTFPTTSDEQQRAGDDFAARIYVVQEHSVLRWRTRALNYVWTQHVPSGSDWPNPFAEQAHMIAVQQGEPGTWQVQTRNLRDDFQHYHDQDYESINALAIMTDCDNTEAAAAARFGTLILHQDPAPPIQLPLAVPFPARGL